MGYFNETIIPFLAASISELTLGMAVMASKQEVLSCFSIMH